MKLTLVYQPSAPASASPYRLLNEEGRGIAWANDFLDAQQIRQLSPRSLRAYAYDLLHFARWWHPARALADLNHQCFIARRIAGYGQGAQVMRGAPLEYEARPLSSVRTRIGCQE